MSRWASTLFGCSVGYRQISGPRCEIDGATPNWSPLGTCQGIRDNRAARRQARFGMCWTEPAELWARCVPFTQVLILFVASLVLFPPPYSFSSAAWFGLSIKWGSHPKSWLRFFAKRQGLYFFWKSSLSATNWRPKGRGSPKTCGTQKKSHLLLFFETGKPQIKKCTTTKWTRTTKRRSKHDLLVMRFFGGW